MKQISLIFGAVFVVFLLGMLLTRAACCRASSSAQTGQTINTVSPLDFSDKLNSGEYVLLDIRTADEFTSGHIKNAAQIDFYQTQNFSDYLDSLDKNKKYLIYCRSGNRSGQALKIMLQKGFVNVSDLSGGYNAWTSTGYPTEK